MEFTKHVHDLHLQMPPRSVDALMTSLFSCLARCSRLEYSAGVAAGWFFEGGLPAEAWKKRNALELPSSWKRVDCFVTVRHVVFFPQTGTPIMQPFLSAWRLQAGVGENRCSGMPV